MNIKRIIKTVKEYVGLSFLCLAIVSIFSPAVYWFMNDHLTQVQVFKKLWFIYPIILLLFGLGLYLLKEKKPF